MQDADEDGEGDDWDELAREERMAKKVKKGLVDEKEFEEAQAASKEASKGLGTKGEKDAVKLDVHDIASLEKNADVPKTDDSPKYSASLYCTRATSPDSVSGGCSPC